MSGTEMTQSQGGRSPFSSTNLGHEEAFQGLERIFRSTEVHTLGIRQMGHDTGKALALAQKKKSVPENRR